MRPHMIVTALAALVLAFALPGVAVAQQEARGTLVIVHHIAGGPEIEPLIQTEGLDGQYQENLLAGQTSAPITIQAGPHQLELYDTSGGLLGSTPITITEGQTLTVNTSGVITSDDDGEEKGTLVFQHDVEPSIPVTLGIVVAGESDEQTVATVAPGTASAEIEVPAGTHELNIYDTDGNVLVPGVDLTIEAGEVSTLYASQILPDVLGGGRLGAREENRDDEIRTPTRVDTGAGGAAGIPLGTGLMVGGLLLAALAGIGARVARRPT